MNYRMSGKQKTLSLDVYSDVSLPKKLVKDGIDPMQAKRQARRKGLGRFKHVREHGTGCLQKVAPNRTPNTIEKNTAWLERNVLPDLGAMPSASIKLRDMVAVLQKFEARRSVKSAHKIKQLCGQVFWFAVVSSPAIRDMTVDLRSALADIPESHYAAVTEPTEANAAAGDLHLQRPHVRLRGIQAIPQRSFRPGELHAAATHSTFALRTLLFITKQVHTSRIFVGNFYIAFTPTKFSLRNQIFIYRHVYCLFSKDDEFV